MRMHGSNGPGSITNLRIDAAILAIKHSFIVDHYDCGAGLGTLHVKGAIAQKYRGAGRRRSGAGTGYIKNYIYDDRLRYLTAAELHRAGPVGLGDRPRDDRLRPVADFLQFLSTCRAKVFRPSGQDADAGPHASLPKSSCSRPARRTTSLVGLEIEAGSIGAAEVHVNGAARRRPRPRSQPLAPGAVRRR